MGGEGHIADMITRMKNNLAQKKSRKEHQKKLNEAFHKSSGNAEIHPIREVHISKEKLEEIRENIKRTSTKERKLGILITTIFTVVVIFSIFYYAYLSFFK